MTVILKILFWGFTVTCMFMSTDENNDKNKTNLLLSSTLVTAFLIAQNLLSKSMTLWIFRLSLLWKIERNCISVLFFITNLSEVVRKKHSFYFYGFLHPRSQNEEKYFHNKHYDKIAPIKKTLKLVKSWKAKKKKVCNLKKLGKS